MATSSVIVGLDRMANVIDNFTNQLVAIKSDLDRIVTELGLAPDGFTTMMAEINAYIPTGSDETLAKDRLTKLAAEFTVLVGKATASAGEL